MEKIKISFDYDSTLSEPIVQDFIKKLIESDKCEIFIITTRLSNEYGNKNDYRWIIKNNEEIFKIVDELGIKRENVIFTEGVGKIDFVKKFDIHLDDDLHEIISINANGFINCMGIHFTNETSIKEIKDYMNEILEDNKKIDIIIDELRNGNGEVDQHPIWDLYNDYGNYMEFNTEHSTFITIPTISESTDIDIEMNGTKIDRMVFKGSYSSPDEWDSDTDLDIGIKAVNYNGHEMSVNKTQYEHLLKIIREYFD